MEEGEDPPLSIPEASNYGDEEEAKSEAVYPTIGPFLFTGQGGAYPGQQPLAYGNGEYGHKVDSQNLEAMLEQSFVPVQERTKSGQQGSPAVDPLPEETNPGQQGSPSFVPETNSGQIGSLVVEPQATSSEVAVRSQQLSTERFGRLSLRDWVARTVVDELDGRAIARQRETEEKNEIRHRQQEEVAAGRHRELMEVFTQQNNENDQLKAHNIGLAKERDAEKLEKERLQEQVTQLSKLLNEVLESMERLEQEIRADKHEDGQLQEWSRELRIERDATRQAKNWLKQKLDTTVEAYKSLERKLDAALEANERLEQELDEVLEANKRQEQELDDTKLHVPKNPEKYPLNPFTGYAIVVSNAVFNVRRGEYKKSMQDVAKQLVADDAQKAVLDDAIRLATALSEYGFEVKPMRNATDDDLLAALVECDMRWEQDKLVLIFIITHGNSAGFELANSKDFSQREVADVLVQRNANGKPTILCMSTCRHQVEGDLDLLDDAQSHVFLVNARRLGQRHFAEDKWFVDGLVKIFEQETERNFLTEITDMRLLQRRLDFDDRLGKILILPAFPARTWPPEEKEKTYNLVKSVFKYDSKPAQTTTAGTA